MLDNEEYCTALMYEQLEDREFAGPREEDVPIDEDNQFLDGFAWDSSDVIQRLLNADDNRVKPKQYNMKE